MKYLVIDTETSGLPRYDLPADDPSQPRLAALAMISVDKTLAVEKRQMLYVRPDGWEMNAEITAINGLTTEFLRAKGVPISDVLAAYCAMIDAPESRAVVAYGAQFDCKVMRGELRRAGQDDRFNVMPNLCMMRAMMGVCRIPQANGRGLKFPKLAEAMAHFKLPFDGAHEADNDADACLQLFRKGLSIGLKLVPEVHQAKPGTGTKAGRARAARTSALDLEGGSVNDVAPADPVAKPVPLRNLADQDIPE